MSAGGTQLRLDDIAGPSDDDDSKLTREEWADYYEHYDGCIKDLVRATGHSEKYIRETLVDLGIHDKRTWEPYRVVKMLPHEAGLDPLNCGLCGEQEIVDHPCPNCGFDPSDKAAETCDECGTRDATTQAFNQSFCDECHQSGEKVVELPLTGEQWRVTKWIERDDGRTIPLEREPVGDDESADGGEAGGD